MYIVRLSADAQADLVRLRRNVPHAFKKAAQLLTELEEHP